MSKETIQNHQAILIQIVRCIHLKKILFEIDPNPDLNFWRLIYGGFLDLAVLEWCKIFGSNAEYTHWKTLVKTDKQHLFRDDLLKFLKISKVEWDTNWNQLKDYRDELVSHHNRNTHVTKYPQLDIALRSSYFYYDYLSGLMQTIDEEPLPKLEDYCKKFVSQSKKIAIDAINATKSYNEKVY